jgi:hypothetical protein
MAIQNKGSGLHHNLKSNNNTQLRSLSVVAEENIWTILGNTENYAMMNLFYKHKILLDGNCRTKLTIGQNHFIQ